MSAVKLIFERKETFQIDVFSKNVISRKNIY